MSYHRTAAVTLVLVATCLFHLTESAAARTWYSREARHVIPPPTPPRPTLPPVFEPATPEGNNVTVTATKTAMLPCVVHNLGNNSVSWIRHRDLHILSVGSVTYTTDSRFQVVPQEDTGDWMLRIQFANPRDSGQYDCQVSSTPPIARTTHLTVIEPEARILRSPEMHVGLGSPINLTCIVPYSPEPPDYLHWYHKERIVRGDGSRIWVKTQLDERSISQLVVTGATANDAGIYTCSPANSREGHITVYVLTGEYPAAMQGGSSVTCVSRHYWACLSICLSVCLSTTGRRPLFLRSALSTLVLTSLLQYFSM